MEKPIHSFFSLMNANGIDTVPRSRGQSTCPPDLLQNRFGHDRRCCAQQHDAEQAHSNAFLHRTPAFRTDWMPLAPSVRDISAEIVIAVPRLTGSPGLPGQGGTVGS